MAKSSKAEAVTKVRGSRASFEEVVVRATAAGADLPTALIDIVRKRFDALEQEIANLDDKEIKDGEARMNVLVDRAEDLERLRAYVMPREELLIEGQSRLSDMNNWAVPQTVIDQLNREVVPQLRGMNVVEARGALRSLYEVYDYWDWWVEEHARSMQLAAKVMLGLLVAFVTGSVFLLHDGHVYSGIFCAGTAGALLSVLAKLPPVLSSGAANAYFYRIVGRVSIGIAASMIGMGLLASDLLSLQLPDHGSIAKMLDGKDLLCGTIDSTPAAPGAAALPSTCAPNDHRFSRRAVLLLMAIAMLFGFSERALSTFENKILPSSTTMIVQTTPDRPDQDRGGAPEAAPPEVAPGEGEQGAQPGQAQPAGSGQAQPAEPGQAQPAAPGKDTA